MAEVILFMVGAACGALVVAFIQGASFLGKQNEIYMEGFRAGQVEKIKEDRE